MPRQATVSSFLKLLVRLSGEIRRDELEKMKFLCQDHVAAGDLTSLQTALQLFQKLHDLQIIDLNNTKFLEDVMETIDRTDLIHKISKYSGNSRNHTSAQSPPIRDNSSRENPTGCDSIREDEEDAAPDQGTGPHRGLLCHPASATSEPLKGLTSSHPHSHIDALLCITMSDHEEETSIKCINPVSRQNSNDDGGSGISLSLPPPSVSSQDNRTYNNNQTRNVDINEEHFSVSLSLSSGSIPAETLSGGTENGPVAIPEVGEETLENSSDDSEDMDSQESHEKDIIWRNYQKELAQPSIAGKNCIICSPTGSGKTYTAGYILQELWQRSRDQNKQFKALFIVNNRHLTTQQQDSLKEVFKQPKVVNKMKEEFHLDVMIRYYDIVVLTAQIVVNALENHPVSLSDFDMLVFDECHHADKQHPYQQIMNFYLRDKVENPGRKLPQIMGLTASLGTGSKQDACDHFISLCSNLDCPTITSVKINTDELLQHNPVPTIDQIIAVEPRMPSQFAKELEGLMERIEISVGLQKIAEYGSLQYNNWIVEQREIAEASPKDTRPVQVSCRALEFLNVALLCYQEHTALNVKIILDEYFNIAKLGPSTTKHEEQIFDYYAKLRADLLKLAEREEAQENKKLKALVELLKQIYSRDKEAKGLLLVHTRMSVRLFMNMFSEDCILKQIIHPVKMVGQQNQSAGDKMTEYEQTSSLKMFRKAYGDPGSANLLVATNVAEEGMDMPKCKFVIRYNFVSNEIGMVQAKGRARTKNSECYLIVDRGSVNHHREVENLQKEHHMTNMLKNWDKQVTDLLHHKIETRQLNMLDRLRQEHEKCLALKVYNPREVGVHCKQCKQELGTGADILKKGPHILCVGEVFKEKTRIWKGLRRNFRYEDQLGQVLCNGPECSAALGNYICYKKGLRTTAFTIAKDAVSFKLPNCNTFVKCKKWANVPFEIKTEEIEC